MKVKASGFFSRILTVAALALSLHAGVALGQVGNATVVGRVQDSAGAVVVGAQIEMRRISTNETFRTATTGSGDYSIVNLPLDTYEMKASNPGFKTEVRSGIELRVGSTPRVDFRLQVGAVTDSVEVVSQAPILKTETAEFGQVIDHSKIEGLPLNSRDVLGTLGSMTPGLAPLRGNPTGSGDNFNVRGQRASDNVVVIDGAFVSQGNAAITFFESPDAVQEFEAKTGLYGAEYGVKPGGQFIMITKSGTNTPHGTLFEQLRNNALDARNFFDRGSRPPFKRNQFGGVFGAPIYVPRLFNGKDRAWFFFSYSGERIRQFTSATGVTPTAAQKSGQFATTITDPLTKQPFAGNLIPASRIDPIAQKLLTFWPDPNTPAQGFNFTSPNSSAASNNNQVVAKVDFKVTDNDRWSARFLKDNSPIPRTNAIQAFFRVDPLSSFSQAINNTRTFKSRVVNEFSVNWFRRPYYAGFQSSSPGYGKTLGIANFPASPTDINGVPAITVTGILGIGDGNNSGPSITGNWEVRDNVSFNSGAHSFKAGYNWRRHIEHYAFVSRSSFSFQPRYTGNAFADFLLGDATSSTPGSEGLRGRINQNGHFFYFRDSWKASSRLTLDLGLRYEYRGPWLDQRGFNSNFLPFSNSYDPPLQNLQLQPWQTGRFVVNQPFISFNKKGWEPRVGVAYRLASKTVIRAGYGAYGNEPSLGMVQDLGRNPRPNVAVKTYLSNATTPDLQLANPFPATINPGVGAPSLTGFDGPMPQNLVHSWGFSIQRQLSVHSVFEAGYQGSHTLHEPIITDQNDATPGTGDRQARRPFPQYQTIRIIHGSGSASYNGLEVKFEQRPGPSGVSLLVSYTWSKSFDTLGGRLGSSGDPTGISRNLSLSVNRGMGEQNPNRLVTNLGYQLPFGPGKPMLPKGIGAAIAGGWSVNSLLSLEKGYYITPILSTDRLDVGSTTSSRPDLLRNPNLPADQRTPQRWFDISGFATPPPLKYGNSGRSVIEGPGFLNLDLSVLRSFRITERSRLEFRFEMFNSLNHTNFSLPGTTFGTGTFGVIGSAFESRDLQFGLKVYF